MLTRESDELRRNKIALIKKIGAGSFATVYSARWEIAEAQYKNIAVKIMRTDEMVDDRFKNQFMDREIQIVKHVSHPNIVKVYQVLTIDQSTIIVCKLCECDLLQYLQTRGAISERVGRRLILELVDAVQYLHQNGIAHRDLKTENLFLTSDGQLQLGDFGFSRYLESENNLCSTRCGSDGYIAPEVISDSEGPFDAKLADIWSIGVILYTMLTKSMPFDRQVMKHMSSKKKMTVRFHPKLLLSGNVRDLIQQFLTYVPTDRIALEAVRRHPWFAKRHDYSLVDSEVESRPSTSRGASIS